LPTRQSPAEADWLYFGYLLGLEARATASDGTNDTSDQEGVSPPPAATPQRSAAARRDGEAASDLLSQYQNRLGLFAVRRPPWR